MASPTRIYLEEPVRVASPTRINLEEPIRVASTTRINSFLCRSSSPREASVRVGIVENFSCNSPYVEIILILST